MEDAKPTPEQTSGASATGETTGESTQTGKSAAEQAAGQELLDELTELADKFADVIRTAWNSEQKKQIETDVRSGLSTLATSLEDGFKQVASSNEAKELQTKATEVGGKVSSTRFFADLTGALTTGLRALSDQLDKLSKDMQAKNPNPGGAPGATPSSQDSPGPDVKDIPINKDR